MHELVDFLRARQLEAEAAEVRRKEGVQGYLHEIIWRRIAIGLAARLPARVGEPALRRLARQYWDHPEHRPEWRP
jgi:hypothetical protein